MILSTNQLLEQNGEKNVYPSPDIHNTMKMLGKNGFLSMIIDKKYGICTCKCNTPFNWVW